MEEFVCYSSNPLSDIVNFFKKECKSFETGIEEGLKFYRMVMSTNLLRKPKELVTVIENQGELLSIGIHGNRERVRKNFYKS